MNRAGAGLDKMSMKRAKVCMFAGKRLKEKGMLIRSVFLFFQIMNKDIYNHNV